MKNENEFDKYKNEIQTSIQNLEREGDIKAFRLSCKRIIRHLPIDEQSAIWIVDDTIQEIEFAGLDCDGQTVTCAVADIFNLSAEKMING